MWDWGGGKRGERGGERGEGRGKEGRGEGERGERRGKEGREEERGERGEEGKRGKKLVLTRDGVASCCGVSWKAEEVLLRFCALLRVASSSSSAVFSMATMSAR